MHPLPSLDASISELDKSLPENPRCKKCKAKFLRGTHSLICIYCGSKIREDDDLPNAISFNSSLGFRWLLNSLDLDQSDSVGWSDELNSKLNKGHRPAKQFDSLHGLLDFHIALSDESEKPKTRVSKKALKQSRTLNLTGAYLGNIFSKSPSMIIYNADALEGPVTEQTETSQGGKKLASSSGISTGDSVIQTSENDDGSLDN